LRQCWGLSISTNWVVFVVPVVIERNPACACHMLQDANIDSSFKLDPNSRNMLGGLALRVKHRGLLTSVVAFAWLGVVLLGVGVAPNDAWLISVLGAKAVLAFGATAGGLALVLDLVTAQRRQPLSLSTRWFVGLPTGLAVLFLGVTIAGTSVREAKEETAYDVEIIGLSGIYSNPAHLGEYTSHGEVRQEFTIVFIGRVVGGAATTNE